MAVKRARVVSAPLLRGIHLYTPFDSLFIDALKALVPADLRQWDKDERCWYIFESYAARVVIMARRYWPDIDLSQYVSANRESTQYEYTGNARTWREQQERARHQREQEHARHQREQQGQRFYQGWAGGLNTPAQSSDHAALFVTADAPPEVIRAAYKALALLYHPDKGGSVERMQVVNAAMDRLRKAGKA